LERGNKEIYWVTPHQHQETGHATKNEVQKREIKGEAWSGMELRKERNAGEANAKEHKRHPMHQASHETGEYGRRNTKEGQGRRRRRRRRRRREKEKEKGEGEVEEHH
jgi:hypothetical protein